MSIVIKTAASCRNRWVFLWVAAIAAAGLRVFVLDDKVATTTISTTGRSDLLTRPESKPATLALWHANTTMTIANSSSYFHGYDSLEQLRGRSQRFPSVDQRVRVYMSNWYEPASAAAADCGNDDDDKVMMNHTNSHVVSYRWIPGGQVVVQEVVANTTEDEAPPRQRQFLIDAQTTLGKLHFLDDRNMRSDQCDSEYCVDVLQYLLPALRRVVVDTTTAMVPVLFQFSDEEISRAFAIRSHSNETYPAVPHFKKSRLSLLHPVKSLDDDDDRLPVMCHRPLPLPAVSAEGAGTMPPHFHPIILKLKTNRHYGMLDQIPPQDLPWHEKRTGVIFRGTLTGLLPAGSAFSMAYRNSGVDLLSDDAAHAKCLELERCRFVYESNQMAAHSALSSQMIDVKLVTPRLQHIDLPETIRNVSLVGDRLTKQSLLQYKAIVMLEGNDAGTGLKWALFSNSVVLAPAPLTFTSWAMEELLVPWQHYIPLDPGNFGVDLLDKMQWIVDHDDQAQEIAQRGSLWIRDLWLHPDAARDDEEIVDDMVRRYVRHFREDMSLEF